jgi:archaellum biogenesis ATPase FlaH
MDEILELEKDHNIRVNNDSLKGLAKKEEPRFLSILLKDKDCLMDAVSYGILPGDNGHFWMPKPRFLYNIILQYYKKYNSILTRTAIDSVLDSLSIVDDDEKTSARMYYDEVYSMESSSEDYELLKSQINNRYVQWQGFSILKKDMGNLIKATNNQDELVKEIQKKFLAIDGLNSDSYCKTLGLVEAMPQIRDYITKRRECPEDNPRVPTGFDALDKKYFLTPGSYTIISGMINGGKTTLMFNLGFNMAKAGYNVCYVSMEKEAFHLILRLTSLHALVDYNKIKNGGVGELGLSDVYYNKLIDATHDLETRICPNFDCIQLAQGTKLSKILSEVDKIRARKKIDVLIVDYLGVIGFETNTIGRPDVDEHNISKRLQAYGKINQLVLIGASQLKTGSSKEIRNKAKKATAENTSDIEVHTEDLAGSKMTIADADNGWSAVLNGDAPPTKMFIYGMKARDDESRTAVTLDFDGRLGRISDPEFDTDHITEVDAIVYGDQIDDDLMSGSSLFDSYEDPISGLSEDAFDFSDTSTKSAPKSSNSMKEKDMGDIFNED